MPKDLQLKRWLSSFFGAGLFSLTVVLLLSSPYLQNSLFIPPDGMQYREWTYYLANLISGRDPGPLTPSIEMRSPGYPFFLMLGLFLTNDFTASVLIVHVLVAWVSLWILITLTTDKLHPLAVACVYSGLFVASQLYFQSVLTEWLVIHLLVLTFVSFQQSIDRPSLRCQIILNFCVTLAVIVKPSLWILVFFPIALLSLQTLTRSARGLISYVPLLLLPVWMSVNFFRIGSFTLAPYGGITLFTVTSLATDLSQIESQNLLASEIRTKEFKVPGNPKLTVDTVDLFEQQYDKNMWATAEELRATHSLSFKQLNSLLGSFAREAVAQRLFGITEFIARNFLTQIRFFTILDGIFWVLVLVSTFLARAGSIAYGWTAMLVGGVLLYLCYMAECSATAIIVYRLWTITYFPLVFIGALQCLRVARNILGRMQTNAASLRTAAS